MDWKSTSFILKYLNITFLEKVFLSNHKLPVMYFLIKLMFNALKAL